MWHNGLAQWGQDGARIRLLRDSADYVIYTLGSDAGVPVSILQSFATPPLSWDTEWMRFSASFPPVANPPSKQPMLTLLKQARAFGVGVVITERWDEALEEFEEMPVTPRRSDIDIDLFALAWAPHWRITYQDRGGITRTDHTGMKCPCYTAVPDESGCWRLLR